MKVILSANDFPTPILKGLEKIERIDLLEDDSFLILYTITDEYMKENDLLYKHRILKINNNLEDYRKIQDYANVMEEK